MPITETTEPATEPRRSALAHPPAHVLFWGLGAALLALDLWSKAKVFATLAPDEVTPVLGPLFEFRRSLNDGAVFGSFTGQTGLFVAASVLALGFVLYLFSQSGARNRVMHVALAMILSGAMGNLYDRAFMKADVIRVPTASGQIGSLIGTIVSDPGDPMIRIGEWPGGGHVRVYSADEVEVHRQGVVRDFIKFVPKFPKGFPMLGGRDVWPWVFNVADAALVVGVILLLFMTSFDRSPQRKRSA